MIETGRTYTLPGTMDIYRAQVIPDGLFLRDLNRSHIWLGVASVVRQGYAEGWLAQGEILSRFGYDVVNGRRIPWGEPQLTWRRVEAL